MEEILLQRQWREALFSHPLSRKGGRGESRLQLPLYGKHAIQRRIELAAHVAGNEHDRQQILVVNHFLAQRVPDLDHFGDRHHLPVTTAQLEFQQLVDAVLALRREDDAHRNFVLCVTVMHRRHILAGKPQAHHIDNVLLRHAEQCRLGLGHAQYQLLRIRVHRVVYADNVCRALESRAHLLRHCDLSGIVGAVDFGDDRRHHRRSRRHFDHLGIAAMLPGNGNHPLAHRDGNLVALAVTMFLVHQVDLDVAHFRCRAQIILAHQAVEVDRAGRSGIGLIVGDLLHLSDLGRDFAQHGGGSLERGADRHVKHDLELALVVEGQHLEHHQLDQAEADRGQDGRQNAQPQLAPRRLAGLRIEQRRHDAAEKPVSHRGRSRSVKAFLCALCVLCG